MAARPWVAVALGDGTIKVFAALTSVILALIVSSAGFHRLQNRALAAFLLLIAGNQAADAGFALVEPGALRDRLFRIGTVFAALDPFVLYYFVTAHPQRSRWNATPYVLLVGVPAAALALLSPIARSGGVYAGGELAWSAAGWHVVALGAFTTAVYTWIWVLGARAAADDPADRGRLVLFYALSVAAVPTWVNARDLVNYALVPLGVRSQPILGLAPIAAVLAPFVLGAVVLALLARRAPERALLWRGFAAGFAMMLLIQLRVPYAALGGARGAPLDLVLATFSTGGASLRWIVFGLLGSIAVIRFDLLGMAMHTRRAASRFLVGALFADAALIATILVEDATGRLTGELVLLELGVVALAIVASQAFPRVTTFAAARLYGAPESRDIVGAMDAYRRAAMQSAEGTEAERAERLRRLREELGLDERAAGLIDQMASDARSRGPIVVGQLVGGRYRVQRFLRRGGTGRTFLAQDELGGRLVVLKEVLHDGDGNEGTVVREARAAASLAHPNILGIEDVVRTTGSSILVSEYMPNGSLADVLERGGKLAEPEARRLLRGILSGLAAVHAAGIVHRDIKPGNILLGAGGEPRIADFGLALNTTGSTIADTQGHGVGTPAFMAPEQTRGERATPRTDVYAAGLVAREILGDATPFAPLLARAAAQDPAARFADAGEMLRALEGADLLAVE